jgi:ATP-dependent helicase/nuclease subunit A
VTAVLRATDAQASAIGAAGSVFISAGAGSGKTRVLAERIVRLLSEAGGPKPRQVVAVTFTEAAAAELRTRVTRFVEARAAGGEAHWQTVLADLPLMTVGTIHSLCGRIAREHPVESRAGLSFLVQDETQARAWLEDKLPLALSEGTRADLLALPGALRREAMEALLADPLAARSALDVAVGLIALPPAERTERVWAEVAGEWDRALSSLAALSGPGGERLEGYRSEVVRLASPAPCPPETLQQLEAVLVGYGKALGGKKWDEDVKVQVHAGLKSVFSLCSRADLRGEVSPALQAQDWAVLALNRLFTAVNARLQEWRSQEEVATFSDLEVYADRALQEAHVRDYYAERFTHLLVDEAQDTNPVQWRILSSLAGPGVNLTVVGDEKQSIYAFRRADVRIFHQAHAHVRQSGGERVAMHTSFRTHGELVEIMNAYFGSLMKGPLTEGSTRATFEPLDAFRPENPATEPAAEWHAIVGEADTGTLRHAEGQYLAARIQGLLLSGRVVHGPGGPRPVRLSDIAVLFRARTDLALYEDAFARAGLPFVVHGGRGLLTRPEVQDALNVLRVVADPTADVTLAGYLRGPALHLSDPRLLALARSREKGETLWTAAERSTDAQVQSAVSTLRELRSLASTLSAAELLMEADARLHLRAIHAAQPDGARRAENLRRLQGLLRLWASDGVRDVTALLAHLRRLDRLEHEEPEAPAPHPDAVQLMTIHGSKGLEFPVVIVADLLRSGGGGASGVRFNAERGVALRLPRTDTPAPAWERLGELEKERDDAEAERIAYVAFTRAADLLILSGVVKDSLAEQKRLAAFESHLPVQGVVRFRVDVGSVTPPPKLDLDVQSGRPRLDVLGGPGASLPDTLPVTALGTYRVCPRQFSYRHVHGFLPLADLWSEQATQETSNPERRVAGRTIGDAVHKAIEGGLGAPGILKAFGHLAPIDLAEVVQLVAAAGGPAFQATPGPFLRERPIQVMIGGVTFEGVVDAWNESTGLVLDYKTDRHLDSAHHLPQLSVYARRLKAKEAALAYLRHDHLHTFSAEELDQGYAQVETDVSRMMALDFTPSPTPAVCSRCAFRGVCDAAEVRA